MSPVPYRLACRALADCLGGQARRLESLTPGRSAGRRGAEAGANAAARSAGRAAPAAVKRSQADLLSEWASDPDASRRPALDAATFGLLVALTYGHGEALIALRAAHPGLLDDVPIERPAEILRRLAAPGASGAK